MPKLTLDELSIAAIYRADSREQTLANLHSIPVRLIAPELQELFCTTRRKLREMSDDEFAALDFRDALVVEEEDGEELWQ